MVERGEPATGFKDSCQPPALCCRLGPGHLGEDGERVEERGKPATGFKDTYQPPAPLLQVRAVGTWKRTANERRKGVSLPLASRILTSPPPLCCRLGPGALGRGR